MTEKRFTPGPWKTNRHGDVFAGQEFICCSGRAYDRSEADRANSHLIAAAPELYEALANCLGHFDTPVARRQVGINSDIPVWLVEARAALAKARGEQS